MPFATNREQRIHFTVDGAGPLVILLHGGLSDSSTWQRSGFVAPLAESFTVVCIDALGHGQSDKPTDSALYSQRHRADDVAAVMDEVGRERAHVAGYSMGGWNAVGVARFHPERLASLVVGGWDVVDGMKSAEANAKARLGLPDLSFDSIYAAAQRLLPDSVAWITEDDIAGLRAASGAVWELEGAEAAIAALTVPVLLWDGADDPYCEPMRALAAAHGFAFLSSPGDHQTAMGASGGRVVEEIRAFFSGSFGPGEARTIEPPPRVSYASDVRYEFASPAWLEAVERVIREAAAEADDLGQLADASFTMCDVYENVPADIHPDGRATWFVRLAGGEVEFGRDELERADLKVVADYSVIKPFTRVEFDGGPPPEIMQQLTAAAELGTFKMQGSAAQSPPAFRSVHNRIVGITL